MAAVGAAPGESTRDHSKTGSGGGKGALIDKLTAINLIPDADNINHMGIADRRLPLPETGAENSAVAGRPGVDAYNARFSASPTSSQPNALPRADPSELDSSTLRALLLQRPLDTLVGVAPTVPAPSAAGGDLHIHAPSGSLSDVRLRRGRSPLLAEQHGRPGALQPIIRSPAKLAYRSQDVHGGGSPNARGGETAISPPIKSSGSASTSSNVAYLTLQQHQEPFKLRLPSPEGGDGAAVPALFLAALRRSLGVFAGEIALPQRARAAADQRPLEGATDWTDVNGVKGGASTAVEATGIADEGAVLREDPSGCIPHVGSTAASQQRAYVKAAADFLDPPSDPSGGGNKWALGSLVAVGDSTGPANHGRMSFSIRKQPLLFQLGSVPVSLRGVCDDMGHVLRGSVHSLWYFNAPRGRWLQVPDTATLGRLVKSHVRSQIAGGHLFLRLRAIVLALQAVLGAARALRARRRGMAPPPPRTPKAPATPSNTAGSAPGPSDQELLFEFPLSPFLTRALQLAAPKTPRTMPLQAASAPIVTGDTQVFRSLMQAAMREAAEEDAEDTGAPPARPSADASRLPPTTVQARMARPASALSPPPRPASSASKSSKRKVRLAPIEATGGTPGSPPPRTPETPGRSTPLSSAISPPQTPHLVDAASSAQFSVHLRSLCVALLQEAWLLGSTGEAARAAARDALLPTIAQAMAAVQVQAVDAAKEAYGGTRAANAAASGGGGDGGPSTSLGGESYASNSSGQTAPPTQPQSTRTGSSRLVQVHGLHEQLHEMSTTSSSASLSQDVGLLCMRLLLFLTAPASQYAPRVQLQEASMQAPARRDSIVGEPPLSMSRGAARRSRGGSWTPSAPSASTFARNRSISGVDGWPELEPQLDSSFGGVQPTRAISSGPAVDTGSEATPPLAADRPREEALTQLAKNGALQHLSTAHRMAHAAVLVALQGALVLLQSAQMTALLPLGGGQFAAEVCLQASDSLCWQREVREAGALEAGAQSAEWAKGGLGLAQMPDLVTVPLLPERPTAHKDGPVLVLVGGSTTGAACHKCPSLPPPEAAPAHWLPLLEAVKRTTAPSDGGKGGANEPSGCITGLASHADAPASHATAQLAVIAGSPVAVAPAVEAALRQRLLQLSATRGAGNAPKGRARSPMRSATAGRGLLLDTGGGAGSAWGGAAAPQLAAAKLSVPIQTVVACINKLRCAVFHAILVDDAVAQQLLQTSLSPAGVESIVNAGRLPGARDTPMHLISSLVVRHACSPGPFCGESSPFPVPERSIAPPAHGYASAFGEIGYAFRPPEAMSARAREQTRANSNMSRASSGDDSTAEARVAFRDSDSHFVGALVWPIARHMRSGGARGALQPPPKSNSASRLQACVLSNRPSIRGLALKTLSCLAAAAPVSTTEQLLRMSRDVSTHTLGESGFLAPLGVSCTASLLGVLRGCTGTPAVCIRPLPLHVHMHGFHPETGPATSLLTTAASASRSPRSSPFGGGSPRTVSPRTASPRSASPRTFSQAISGGGSAGQPGSTRSSNTATSGSGSAFAFKRRPVAKARMATAQAIQSQAGVACMQWLQIVSEAVVPAPHAAEFTVPHTALPGAGRLSTKEDFEGGLTPLHPSQEGLLFGNYCVSLEEKENAGGLLALLASVKGGLQLLEGGATAVFSRAHVFDGRRAMEQQQEAPAQHMASEGYACEGGLHSWLAAAQSSQGGLTALARCEAFTSVESSAAGSAAQSNGDTIRSYRLQRPGSIPRKVTSGMPVPVQDFTDMRGSDSLNSASDSLDYAHNNTTMSLEQPIVPVDVAAQAVELRAAELRRWIGFVLWRGSGKLPSAPPVPAVTRPVLVPLHSIAHRIRAMGPLVLGPLRDLSHELLPAVVKGRLHVLAHVTRMAMLSATNMGAVHAQDVESVVSLKDDSSLLASHTGKSLSAASTRTVAVRVPSGLVTSLAAQHGNVAKALHDAMAGVLYQQRLQGSQSKFWQREVQSPAAEWLAADASAAYPHLQDDACMPLYTGEQPHPASSTRPPPVRSLGTPAAAGGMASFAPRPGAAALSAALCMAAASLVPEHAAVSGRQGVLSQSDMALALASGVLAWHSPLPMVAFACLGGYPLQLSSTAAATNAARTESVLTSYKRQHRLDSSSAAAAQPALTPGLKASQSRQLPQRHPTAQLSAHEVAFAISCLAVKAAQRAVDAVSIILVPPENLVVLSASRLPPPAGTSSDSDSKQPPKTRGGTTARHNATARGKARNSAALDATAAALQRVATALCIPSVLIGPCAPDSDETKRNVKLAREHSSIVQVSSVAALLTAWVHGVHVAEETAPPSLNSWQGGARDALRSSDMTAGALPLGMSLGGQSRPLGVIRHSNSASLFSKEDDAASVGTAASAQSDATHTSRISEAFARAGKSDQLAVRAPLHVQLPCGLLPSLDSLPQQVFVPCVPPAQMLDAATADTGAALHRLHWSQLLSALLAGGPPGDPTAPPNAQWTTWRGAWHTAAENPREVASVRQSSAPNVVNSLSATPSAPPTALATSWLLDTAAAPLVDLTVAAATQLAAAHATIAYVLPLIAERTAGIVDNLPPLVSADEDVAAPAQPAVAAALRLRRATAAARAAAAAAANTRDSDSDDTDKQPPQTVAAAPSRPPPRSQPPPSLSSSSLASSLKSPIRSRDDRLDSEAASMLLGGRRETKKRPKKKRRGAVPWGPASSRSNLQAAGGRTPKARPKKQQRRITIVAGDTKSNGSSAKGKPRRRSPPPSAFRGAESDNEESSPATADNAADAAHSKPPPKSLGDPFKLDALGKQLSKLAPHMPVSQTLRQAAQVMFCVQHQRAVGFPTVRPLDHFKVTSSFSQAARRAQQAPRGAQASPIDSARSAASDWLDEARGIKSFEAPESARSNSSAHSRMSVGAESKADRNSDTTGQLSGRSATSAGGLSEPRSVSGSRRQGSKGQSRAAAGPERARAKDGTIVELVGSIKHMRVPVVARRLGTHRYAVVDAADVGETLGVLLQCLRLAIETATASTLALRHSMVAWGGLAPVLGAQLSLPATSGDWSVGVSAAAGRCMRLGLSISDAGVVSAAAVSSLRLAQSHPSLARQLYLTGAMGVMLRWTGALLHARVVACAVTDLAQQKARLLPLLLKRKEDENSTAPEMSPGSSPAHTPSSGGQHNKHFAFGAATAHITTPQPSVVGVPQLLHVPHQSPVLEPVPLVQGVIAGMVLPLQTHRALLNTLWCISEATAGPLAPWLLSNCSQLSQDQLQALHATSAAGAAKLAVRLAAASQSAQSKEDTHKQLRNRLAESAMLPQLKDSVKCLLWCVQHLHARHLQNAKPSQAENEQGARGMSVGSLPIFDQVAASRASVLPLVSLIRNILHILWSITLRGTRSDIWLFATAQAANTGFKTGQVPAAHDFGAVEASQAANALTASALGRLLLPSLLMRVILLGDALPMGDRVTALRFLHVLVALQPVNTRRQLVSEAAKRPEFAQGLIPTVVLEQEAVLEFLTLHILQLCPATTSTVEQQMTSAAQSTVQTAVEQAARHTMHLHEGLTPALLRASHLVAQAHAVEDAAEAARQRRHAAESNMGQRQRQRRLSALSVSSSQPGKAITRGSFTMGGADTAGPTMRSPSRVQGNVDESRTVSMAADSSASPHSQTVQQDSAAPQRTNRRFDSDRNQHSVLHEYTAASDPADGAEASWLRLAQTPDQPAEAAGVLAVHMRPAALQQVAALAVALCSADDGAYRVSMAGGLTVLLPLLAATHCVSTALQLLRCVRLLVDVAQEQHKITGEAVGMLLALMGTKLHSKVRALAADIIRALSHHPQVGSHVYSAELRAKSKTWREDMSKHLGLQVYRAVALDRGSILATHAQLPKSASAHLDALFESDPSMHVLREAKSMIQVRGGDSTQVSRGASKLEDALESAQLQAIDAKAAANISKRYSIAPGGSIHAQSASRGSMRVLNHVPSTPLLVRSSIQGSAASGSVVQYLRSKQGQHPLSMTDKQARLMHNSSVDQLLQRPSSVLARPATASHLAEHRAWATGGQAASGSMQHGEVLHSPVRTPQLRTRGSNAAALDGDSPGPSDSDELRQTQSLTGSIGDAPHFSPLRNTPGHRPNTSHGFSTKLRAGVTAMAFTTQLGGGQGAQEVDDGPVRDQRLPELLQRMRLPMMAPKDKAESKAADAAGKTAVELLTLTPDALARHWGALPPSLLRHSGGQPLDSAVLVTARYVQRFILQQAPVADGATGGAMHDEIEPAWQRSRKRIVRVFEPQHSTAADQGTADLLLKSNQAALEVLQQRFRQSRGTVHAWRRGERAWLARHDSTMLPLPVVVASSLWREGEQSMLPVRVTPTGTRHSLPASSIVQLIAHVPQLQLHTLHLDDLLAMPPPAPPATLTQAGIWAFADAELPPMQCAPTHVPPGESGRATKRRARASTGAPTRSALHVPVHIPLHAAPSTRHATLQGMLTRAVLALAKEVQTDVRLGVQHAVGMVSSAAFSGVQLDRAGRPQARGMGLSSIAALARADVLASRTISRLPSHPFQRDASFASGVGPTPFLGQHAPEGGHLTVPPQQRELNAAAWRGLLNLAGPRGTAVAFSSLFQWHVQFLESAARHRSGHLCSQLQQLYQQRAVQRSRESAVSAFGATGGGGASRQAPRQGVTVAHLMQEIHGDLPAVSLADDGRGGRIGGKRAGKRTLPRLQVPGQSESAPRAPAAVLPDDANQALQLVREAYAAAGRTLQALKHTVLRMTGTEELVFRPLPATEPISALQSPSNAAEAHALQLRQAILVAGAAAQSQSTGAAFAADMAQAACDATAALSAPQVDVLRIAAAAHTPLPLALTVSLDDFLDTMQARVQPLVTHVQQLGSPGHLNLLPLLFAFSQIRTQNTFASAASGFFADKVEAFELGNAPGRSSSHADMRLVQPRVYSGDASPDGGLPSGTPVMGPLSPPQRAMQPNNSGFGTGVGGFDLHLAPSGDGRDITLGEAAAMPEAATSASLPADWWGSLPPGLRLHHGEPPSVHAALVAASLQGADVAPCAEDGLPVAAHLLAVDRDLRLCKPGGRQPHGLSGARNTDERSKNTLLAAQQVQGTKQLQLQLLARYGRSHLGVTTVPVGGELSSNHSDGHPALSMLHCNLLPSLHSSESQDSVVSDIWSLSDVLSLQLPTHLHTVHQQALVQCVARRPHVGEDAAVSWLRSVHSTPIVPEADMFRSEPEQRQAPLLERLCGEQASPEHSAAGQQHSLVSTFYGRSIVMGRLFRGNLADEFGGTESAAPHSEGMVRGGALVRADSSPNVLLTAQHTPSGIRHPETRMTAMPATETVSTWVFPRWLRRWKITLATAPEGGVDVQRATAPERCPPAHSRQRLSVTAAPKAGGLSAVHYTEEVSEPLRAFMPRVRLSEDRSLLPRKEVLSAAARLDWGQIMRRPGAKGDLEAALPPGDSVEAVAVHFNAEHPRMSQLFFLYSSLHLGDAFSVREAEFMQLCIDARLVGGRSPTLTAQEAKSLYASTVTDWMTESTQAASLRSPVARRQLHSASRWEFCELILRLAACSHQELLSSEAFGLGRALSALVVRLRRCSRVSLWQGHPEEFFQRFAGPWYRSNRLYAAFVGDTLLQHDQLISLLHRMFAAPQTLQVAPGNGRLSATAATAVLTLQPDEDMPVLMSLPGWLSLVHALNLVREGSFDLRAAVLCFMYSKTTCSDWSDVHTWQERTHLTAVDFAEALCRVADLYPLPTESDVARVGMGSALEFWRRTDSAGGSAQKYGGASTGLGASELAEAAGRIGTAAAARWESSRMQPLQHRLQYFLELLAHRAERRLARSAKLAAR